MQKHLLASVRKQHPTLRDEGRGVSSGRGGNAIAAYGTSTAECLLPKLCEMQNDIGILRRNDILFAEYGLLARCHEQGERKKQILLHKQFVQFVKFVVSLW